MTTVRNYEALAASLAEALVDLVEARCVAIHVTDGRDRDQQWSCRFHAGAVQSSLEDPDRYAEFCARHGTFGADLIEDVCGPNALTVFPLLNSGREVRAVVELQTPSALAGEMLANIDTLLKIFSNVQALLEYGQSDALTGLLNRKTFDESFFRAKASMAGAALGRTTERRANAGIQYWVAMIDIDHFKAVNDRFGHQIGDEVLLLVAQQLRRCLRVQDLCYRFGGEEFVVMLRCESQTIAARVFERMRAAIERFEFPRVGRVTVSVGFARLDAGDSPTSALGRADKAVYFAKSSGRNQVRHVAEVQESSGTDGAHADDEVEMF